ncbi:MFS transporter [Dinghuibacter silviterrae]|uniref:FSR family fosmidomycin resistance protein-like MFS transporter n=1 Tax=Dinghuibacter silviterrae TaxID=1539049 RepID=A0A4R8DGZ7_9BACT|nr:MFS transporter [Dinghuibacter silviterrae]TDW96757.1 FSR family fosmidomycin resistance protein-like MFS transporter [Dinghuibacter silviterrae]
MKDLQVTGTVAPSALQAKQIAERTVYSVLVMISISHLLNDTIQSLIPSIYPLLKQSLHVSFGQLGMITFTFQLTASLLQPMVGFFTDKRPQPWSLAAGMTFSLGGLVCLSMAHTYAMVLVSVALVGIGSSIFHPESSRVAFLASGGKRGLAQSVFQLGGNAGSSLGPLLAAWIVVPHGQRYIAWFSLAAVAAIVVLLRVGAWYRVRAGRTVQASRAASGPPLPARTVIVSLGILLALIFSKYFYLASMSSYYTFYLMSKFGVSVQNAQIHLFIFLFAVAAGTLIGGPVGDRYGRKYVIWFSILGVAPFTLMLPYASLFWTTVLTVFIGVILASAFSAILVYAQELVPGKLGMIAGLFFGLAFGMGGLGSAVLGNLADHTSIRFVYKVCSFLPLIGLLTGFLPNIELRRQPKRTI